MIRCSFASHVAKLKKKHRNISGYLLPHAHKFVFFCGWYEKKQHKKSLKK